MICTWYENGKQCRNQARHHLQGADGEVWAMLCDAHHDVWQQDVAKQEPAELLGDWIKVQGGTVIAMKRMKHSEDIRRAQQLKFKARVRQDYELE